MKNLKNLILIISVFIPACIIAQDFTATIKNVARTSVPSTLSGYYLLGPQKSYSTFSVEVTVKNNLVQTVDGNGNVTDPKTYRITPDPAYLGGFIQYDITPASMELKGSESGKFTFKLTPTADITYGMNVDNSYQEDMNIIFYFRAAQAAAPYNTTACQAPDTKDKFIIWVDDNPPGQILPPKISEVHSKSLKITNIAFRDDDKKHSIKVFISVVGGSSYNATNGIDYSVSNLIPNTYYTIYVTATDEAGNSSPTTTITGTTAPEAPTITSYTNNYCSITLNWTASAGATSYKLYNSNNTLVATTTATSWTVTGLTPGNSYSYYVTAIGSNGTSDPGPKYTASTSLPTPEISTPVNMCINRAQNINIKAIPGATSYNWSVNNTLAIYTESPGQPFSQTTPFGITVYSKSTGLATVSVNATLGSCATSNTITKTFYVESLTTPDVYANVVSKCGEPLEIKYTAYPFISGAKSTYKWYSGGTLSETNIDNNTFDRMIPCNQTVYVKCTYANSCGTSPYSDEVEITNTTCSAGKGGSGCFKSVIVADPDDGSDDINGISRSNKYIVENNEEGTDDFQVYPNPATSVVNLKIPAGAISVAIYNSEGKQLYFKNLKEVTRDFQVPVKSYNAGLYYIKLAVDNAMFTKKLIVIK